MKESTKILLILLACFVVAGIFFFSLYSGLSSSPPPISRASFFELTIANNIGERATDDPFLASLGGDVETGLQDILSSIRKAKMDDKIKGILLKPKFVGAGWGKTEEIRNALLDFKESGKPLYAYIEAVSNKEYYLASTADSIFGLGTGLMLVSGFLSEPMFLKDTFKKIGIEADFVAHGKYKSAPEVYTRGSMSDPQREVLNNLLDQFFDNLINKIADARSIPAEVMKKHVDEGFYTLDRASSYQLVDSLIYYHELKDMIKEKHGDNLRFVGLNRYKQVPFSSLGVSGDRQIAVIYGVGTIVMGSAGLNGQNDLITSEGMAADIKKAAEDDDIEAIILRVDSPGGSGTASDVIWREVVEARKVKPVIVSISDVCASGGYYISMAADTIVAHPNSIVGSIGVFAGKFSWDGLYDEIDANISKVKRGRNADFFSTSQTFTDEQKTIMRRFIMEFYQDFISKVAEGRGMTVEAVDEIAQGRVWTASDGKDIGLIDVLGDFRTAVNIAKEMVDIPEDEAVQLITYPKTKTYLEQLLAGNISVRDMTKIDLASFMIPESFHSTIHAIPHFKAGEPLFLFLNHFELN